MGTTCKECYVVCSIVISSRTVRVFGNEIAMLLMLVTG